MSEKKGKTFLHFEEKIEIKKTGRTAIQEIRGKQVLFEEFSPVNSQLEGQTYWLKDREYGEIDHES